MSLKQRYRETIQPKLLKDLDLQEVLGEFGYGDFWTLLERYLPLRLMQQARIEHYVCDQCHGIHMVSLQSVEGIQESRIFVEEEGLLFSSELEVRPSSLLPLVAELGRLNMQYPSLKVFLDIIDDNLPRLVVGHTVFTKAGRVHHHRGGGQASHNRIRLDLGRS